MKTWWILKECDGVGGDFFFFFNRNKIIYLDQFIYTDKLLLTIAKILYVGIMSSLVVYGIFLISDTDKTACDNPSS